MAACVLAALLFLAVGSTHAGNPLLPGTGTADTNVHLCLSVCLPICLFVCLTYTLQCCTVQVHHFNGTFLIFADHDYSVNNTGFRSHSQSHTHTQAHFVCL